MQTIITKYLGPTNSRGSRIVAKCWNGKTTVSWDYRLNAWDNHRAAADALIAERKERTGMEWKIIAVGCLPDDTGYAFIIQ